MKDYILVKSVILTFSKTGAWAGNTGILTLAKVRGQEYRHLDFSEGAWAGNQLS